jgi:RHS repeat-associated protein
VYAGGVNVPALMVTPTATYRLVTDHLGSVRRVVDVATGAVVQELEYDAWGRVLLDTSPGLQPFGFAGGLYDPDTGLVRFGARDYDAETGRWTAKDPILLADGTNTYAYARSEPAGGIDPTGKALFGLNFFWHTSCLMAARTAAESFMDSLGPEERHRDKKGHCLGTCYYNRCTALATPGLGVGISYAIEAWDEFVGTSGWSNGDLYSDMYGIDQSYDLTKSCEEICDSAEACGSEWNDGDWF